MKRIILFSTLLFAVGFMSCKKCQTCQTKVTQDVGFGPITTSASEEYCGDQYDDAPAEVTVNQEVGGVTQTVVISCEDS